MCLLTRPAGAACRQLDRLPAGGAVLGRGAGVHAGARTAGESQQPATDAASCAVPAAKGEGTTQGMAPLACRGLLPRLPAGPATPASCPSSHYSTILTLRPASSSLASLTTPHDPAPCLLPPLLPSPPQRDCEVEVTSVDRVGNFQGVLRIGRMNLGGAWVGARSAGMPPSAGGPTALSIVPAGRHLRCRRTHVGARCGGC